MNKIKIYPHNHWIMVEEGKAESGPMPRCWHLIANRRSMIITLKDEDNRIQNDNV